MPSFRCEVWLFYDYSAEPEINESLKVSGNAKLLLTPKEAAELLGIPESTLAQWRSQRRGPPYIKMELRLVRYRLSDLEAYLSGHTIGTEIDKYHAQR